ncbi:MAG: hypothetical protein QOH43_2839 [Solirubrobacteraceae bacterium]|nr:hypothetical protein [Solirubrobacteraceae bacterium]
MTGRHETLVRLDDWLPRPAVRVRHARRAAAGVGAEELWAAASTVRLGDTPRLGRLVRWRIPGLSGDLTYREMFREYPFTVLDDGTHASVSGLCGRIWTLSRDYPRLAGAEDFTAWDRSGTVRVVFGHWVQEAEDGRAELVSEARVQPTDRLAALRLRALWAGFGMFERLIGAEPLTVAVRRAR